MIPPEVLEALPRARLARNGRYVVCSTPGCGARIAKLRTGEETGAGPELRMLVGWVNVGPDAQRWLFSRRTWRLQSQGQEPRLRRPKTWAPALQAGAHSGPGIVGLPVVALCVACERPNVLGPELLTTSMTMC
ncbi:MAG TPA: hypothetical protein VNO79_07865 [Actinomycetota bacterium]|nr:hypothetical protein [Actinomycetota bacterium]